MFIWQAYWTWFVYVTLLQIYSLSDFPSPSKLTSSIVPSEQKNKAPGALKWFNQFDLC